MPQRKKLKRRFGKDHQRPIMQKFDTRYAENYDKIDWSKKNDKKKKD